METSGELIRAMLNMSKQHGIDCAIQRKVALGDIIETGTQINGRSLCAADRKRFLRREQRCMARDDHRRRYRSGGQLLFRRRPAGKICHRGAGTRHRAGIGSSEISDVVVIIVSEETGQISAVVEGRPDPQPFGRHPPAAFRWG